KRGAISVTVASAAAADRPDVPRLMPLRPPPRRRRDRDPLEHITRSLLSNAEYHRYRAVVVRVRIRHAPVHVVVAREAVHRLLALVAVAFAVAAARLAAAIVVRDDVIAAIGGIVARADPGDRRGRRAGRAGVCSAAATGAQKSVDRTVLPILAALRVGRRLSGGRS